MNACEPRAEAREEAGWFWFLGTKMTVRVSAADTDGGYGMIEQTLPAGFSPPLHIHHGEDEQFYILAGRITFRCGGRSLPAGPGSLVQLPRGVPHAFTVESPEGAHLLQLTSPGGVEQFFVELGAPLSEHPTPPAGPPDFDKMARLAAEYRIEFVHEE